MLDGILASGIRVVGLAVSAQSSTSAVPSAPRTVLSVGASELRMIGVPVASPKLSVPIGKART